MKQFLLFLFLTIIVQSCKNKEESEEKTTYFPALSFIKSQIAHVDTSVYRIVRVTRSGNTTDTTFLKREEFRNAAKDFLTLPDISSNELKDEYTETKQYDPELDQVSFIYLPKEKDDNQIIQQNVVIKPSPGGDKVIAIFIDQLVSDDERTIQKKLFWEVDKRFRVNTITQQQNQPERTETVEVTWSELPPAQ